MPEVDPAELLKRLELELNLRRPAPKSDSRNSFRIWSLVMLVGGTIAALCALEYFLSELPRPVHPQSAPEAAANEPSHIR